MELTRNQTILIVALAVAAAGTAAFFLVDTSARLAWYKSSDVPNATPSDYTYEWHVQLPASPIECYHNWMAQAIPSNQGQPPFDTAQIFRDSILMPGTAKYPATFRCNPIDNLIWVIGTDGNWYRWNPIAFNWEMDVLPSGTPLFPTYTEIANVSCNDAAANPLGYRCETPFQPIGAVLPDAMGGQILFFLRAKFGEMVSPDSAFLLIGVLNNPKDVRLVPIE